MNSPTPDTDVGNEKAIIMRRIIRHHKTVAGAVSLFACTILAVAALGAPRAARGGGARLWPSHFGGDHVVVTFAVPPPGMGRAVKAQLMDAETPGVVLKLGNEEIFFAFANTISVEPVRQ